MLSYIYSYIVSLSGGKASNKGKEVDSPDAYMIEFNGSEAILIAYLLRAWCQFYGLIGKFGVIPTRSRHCEWGAYPRQCHCSL
jgi:hypothetical protein